MIIDHQAHWYPPIYLESICGRQGFPRTTRLADGGYRFEMGPDPGDWRFDIASRFSDLDEQLADMDTAGVDIAVLNPNMLGEVAGWDLAEARETIELLNTETASAQQRHPDRIVGLCMLPMQDADAALEALDHAEKLDLRGVLMVSNLAGGPITAPHTAPIYQRIDELGWPVFLHPASNSMLYDRGLNPVLDWSAGWMFDSSVAALSLILDGVLDRCPNIEVVHPHLGGIVPYIVGRAERYARYLAEPIAHPVAHYLRTRFYVDVVTHTPAAVALAEHTYGRERLVYGDDYPWHLHAETRTLIEEELAEDLVHAVLYENRVASLRLTGKPDRSA
jgi:aminocarboxymuconate-semialdehyde decarboxylase